MNPVLDRKQSLSLIFFNGDLPIEVLFSPLESSPVYFLSVYMQRTLLTFSFIYLSVFSLHHLRQERANDAPEVILPAKL